MTAQARKGDWMQTFTGRAFWPMDPDPEEIDIMDIAHALSMQCRYGGHVREFYSVAEHSVHISHLCRREHALWGLLHDASEAYVQDVIRPIKPFLGDYKAIEEGMMAAICERFGLAPLMPLEIKTLDTAILVNEAQSLMSDPPIPWGMVWTPLAGVTIQCWSPAEARDQFLSRFHDLMF